MNTDKLFNNDANQKIGMMETMYRIMSHIMDPALYDKKPDNVEEEENDIGKQ